MTKKILTGILGLTMLVGTLTISLPARAADAATYYCSTNYRTITSNFFSFPFKLTYRIVKYPGSTVPTKPNPVPMPAPAPAPNPENTPKPIPQPEPTPVPVPEQKPAPAPQPTPDPEVSASLNAYEQKVVELVNGERQKNGLQALAIDPELSKVARIKSLDMRDNNYFSHQSPTYGSPFDMLKQFGISYRTAGENIAAGQKTPEDVVTAWMGSPGHRANILNSNFTHIGVGYVAGGSYGSYWTQQFIGK